MCFALSIHWNFAEILSSSLTLLGPQVATRCRSFTRTKVADRQQRYLTVDGSVCSPNLTDSFPLSLDQHDFSRYRRYISSCLTIPEILLLTSSKSNVTKGNLFYIIEISQYWESDVATFTSSRYLFLIGRCCDVIDQHCCWPTLIGHFLSQPPVSRYHISNIQYISDKRMAITLL